MDVNPNFAAYAHALGKRPEEMDQGAAINARFMSFITDNWTEFAAETDTTKMTPGWSDLFSAWLTTRYPEPQEPTP